MLYYRIEYALDGDFPEGLAIELAYPFLAFLAAWLTENDLLSAAVMEDDFDRLAIEGFVARKITPTELLQRAFCEELCDDQLSETGAAFVAAYWDRYATDYADVLDAYGNRFYEVRDTWDNYQCIALRIAQRFEAWRKLGQGQG